MQPFADNGLILGTVIDSDDPEGLGNIRVEFPDLASQPSTWAPVSTMMASGGAGTWFRPKPGDQVLVGFERGNPKSPIVIGSIWFNADQQPPDDGDPGENNWQQIVSRSGALLRFDDSPEAILEALRGDIPHLLPEWDDYNEADPGIAMLQLFAV